jgi:uncharacterized membrane protein YhiD involved in acid resistance
MPTQTRAVLTAVMLAVSVLALPAGWGGAPALGAAAGQPPAEQGLQQPQPPSPPGPPLSEADIDPWSMALREVRASLVRLPLAALLGTILALRPKRRGTPKRTTPVIQTQIVLSVVGAVIMLIVGTSLARAFGIVGVASLIRYRSKIDDPKDAVVMLCALSVGLAAGVGLYALSIFATAFIVLALYIIESFEPETQKNFELKIKLGSETDSLRPKVERILSRYRIEFEIRTASDEELCYDVKLPLQTETEPITDAILALDPDGHGAVNWGEKKEKK